MIDYSQVGSEETFTDHIWDCLATERNFSSAKTTTRFLIITMPDGYQSNIAKTLEQTFYSSYVPILKLRIIHRYEME